jgi:hypothetical protein
VFYPPELLTWVADVSSHLPSLSKTQAQVVAWYSFAVSVVQRSGISHVVYFLASVLKVPEGRLRQRLREALYDGQDKRGTGRRAIAVGGCFRWLLDWAVAHGEGADDTLFLALDATTLQQRFSVLSVSVLVGGTAIPVAWRVVRATQPGAWKPHWLALLNALCGACPGRDVLVVADRGLYAKWLFDAIRANHWHPLLRIQAQGHLRLLETGQRLSLAQLAAHCRHACQDTWWRGAAVCFAGQARLTCTLLALACVHHKAAWLLVSDLPPARVSPSWYALRMWIEAGFRAVKSGLFHWHHTRMTHPARAERLWLILALAALRLALLAPPLDPSPSASPRLSLLKRGLLAQLAAPFSRQPLSFHPLPFPPLPPSPLLDFLPQLNTYP